MAAPQLGSDSLNLGTAIPLGGWPWMASLDSQTRFAFGSNLCGPLEY